MYHHRPTVGDIQEIFRSENHVRFEWRIEEIFFIRKDVYISYHSPEISFLGTKFNLITDANETFRLGKEWIGVGIESMIPKKSILFTLGIKLADGTERNIVYHKRLSGLNIHYEEKFLLRYELLSGKSKLAPSDILTLTCAMWSNEPPVKVPEINMLSLNTNTERVAATSFRKDQSAHLDTTAEMTVSRETQNENVSDTCLRAEKLNDLDIKGVCILRNHLKDLLVDGDDHDVIFKVKNREFRAHRSMLRARSPVFAALFKLKMKECTNNHIDIVDCSPEAFREFLQYVYTGKIENFVPSTMLDLYYAGDKYDVSGLKEVCVEFLKTSLSTTAICDVITLAATYGEEELYERAMAFFSEHLDEIVITKEWQNFPAENLVQANETYLKAVKSLKNKKK